MSEKATCPGCSSHTSGVLAAIERDEPCPYCGLSASSIVEINAIRQSRADEQLRMALEGALLRAGRAEAELARLQSLFWELEAVIERWPKGD